MLSIIQDDRLKDEENDRAKFSEFFFFFGGGRNSPQWARASSFTRFLDYTQRLPTVGRTPLDE
jgi:hypothetical protein